MGAFFILGSINHVWIYLIFVTRILVLHFIGYFSIQSVISDPWSFPSPRIAYLSLLNGKYGNKILVIYNPVFPTLTSTSNALHPPSSSLVVNMQFTCFTAAIVTCRMFIIFVIRFSYFFTNFEIKFFSGRLYVGGSSAFDGDSSWSWETRCQ